MSRRHYDEVLGKRYAWMLGELDPLVEAELTIVNRLGVGDGGSRRAVDLGCGTGLHTRMLLSLGYDVLAVDQSERVLETLADLPVDIRCSTLSDVLPLRDRVVLAVCMGDTLAHLSPTVQAEVLATWRPERELLLSFRDLSGVRVGDEISFVVRQDGTRIHTCILRGDVEQVQVTDVFHERRGGDWGVVTSTYPKWRIDRDAVVSTLEKAGATVTTHFQQGVVYLRAAAPHPVHGLFARRG